MKKYIIAFTIVLTVVFSFTNIYATNIINNTRDTMVNVYDEVNDMGNDMMNNIDNMMGKETTMDGLSVVLTIAFVMGIAGVIFYYLIPKK